MGGAPPRVGPTLVQWLLCPQGELPRSCAVVEFGSPFFTHLLQDAGPRDAAAAGRPWRRCTEQRVSSRPESAEAPAAMGSSSRGAAGRPMQRICASGGQDLRGELLRGSGRKARDAVAEHTGPPGSSPHRIIA